MGVGEDSFYCLNVPFSRKQFPKVKSSYRLRIQLVDATYWNLSEHKKECCKWRIKGISIALSFRISPLLFKIRNQVDLQPVYSVRALSLACPVFFAHVSHQQPHT